MVGEFQQPLPGPEVVMIGLVAAVVVIAPTLWNIVQHAETVAHEGAHVVAGILAGRKILGVTIDTDGGGGTDMEPKSGFGYGVAAFVGYIGASIGGLIAAALISTGRMVAVLWLGLALFALMLLTVRNFFGLIVILTCGALLYLVARYGTAGVDTAVAYGVTWFLLLSGTRVAFRAFGKPKEVADAQILAKMTFLFRSAWCLLWLIGTIAALIIGGAILTHALSWYESDPRIPVCLSGP
jgi:Peptidase M50B-like